MSESALARPPSPPMEFTDDQRRMIRDAYANGASAEEFAVLMEIAQGLALSPLKRQIHFVSRFDSDKGRHVWSAQVSIDGLRALAQRSGLYAGQDRPVWVERDGQIVSCEVAVYRKDWPRPAVGVAFFNEYVQTRHDRQSNRRVPTGLWGKMPHAMLAKCAEALALRKAFPEDAGGVYTDEEMLQADGTPVVEAERVHQLDADSPKSEVRAAAVPTPALEASTAPREEPAAAPAEPAAPPVEPTAPPATPPVEPTAPPATPPVEPAAPPATVIVRDEVPTVVPEVETSPALDSFLGALSEVNLPSDGTKLWVSHRRAIEQLPDAQRQAAWQGLAARVEKVGKMKNAMAWLRKAVQEALATEAKAAETAQEPEFEPDPDGGSSGGDVARQSGTRVRGSARRVSTGSANQARSESDAIQNAADFARHLTTLRTAGHVAGAYWKRRVDFLELGIEAEAFAVTLDALRALGIRSPSNYVEGVGVRSGHVAAAELPRVAFDEAA